MEMTLGGAAMVMESNSSLQIKLRNILSLYPLKRRILELSRLFQESSYKELQFILPILIDCIFNVSPSYGPGWNIRHILRHSNLEDFEAGVMFLHPQGSLMDVIYKLLGDPFLKYEYPLTHIPQSFKYQIEQGAVPNYFTDKLIWHPQNRTPISLSLNPYELFIYHFVFHLVAPWQTGPEKPQDKPLESVYLELCDFYLYHLFPIKTSVIFPEIYVQQTAPRSPPPVQHVSKLFKQSALNITSQSVIVQPHGEIWRSETFLNVFIQFWLVIIEPNKLNDSLGVSPKKFLSANDDTDRAQDQLRAIRSMIKHMHYFANNIRNDNSCLDELRKNIRTILQPHIYNFLQYRMRHWPLDNSFILILETYLSYIQPWRYLNYDPSCPIGQSKSVESCWIPFINDNLSAYTVISRQILKRFCRMDLSSSRNAFMIFRLVKAFKEPSLPDFLRTLCTREQHDQTLNLFTTDTEKIVWELMIHMKCIITKLKNDEAVELSNAQSTSFYQKICDMLFLTDKHEVLTEINKTIAYLSTSMGYLEEIFNMESPGDENVSQSVSTSSSINGSITPEEARYRVKKLKYEGHPDLMPIQPYEITSWVRALHRFSTILNQQHGDVFEEVWHRDDLLGRTARQLLAPPCQFFYFDKSGPGQPAPRVAQKLPPRVCLRPLAHRRVAFYFLGLLILPFTNFTSFHPMTLYLFFILMIAVFVVVRAWLAPWFARRPVTMEKSDFVPLDVSFNE